MDNTICSKGLARASTTTSLVYFRNIIVKRALLGTAAAILWYAAVAAQAGVLDAISIIDGSVTIKSTVRDVTTVAGAGASAGGVGRVSVGNSAATTNVHGVLQQGASAIRGNVVIDGTVRDVRNIGGTTNVGGVLQGATAK